MPRNPFDFELEPVKIADLGSLSPKIKSKRTLGIRDKQILYERAKGKCEACGRKIEFSEMQAGHKTAAAKGGNATMRNSVCLCYKCNKLQGTDNWATFMRKRGKPTSATSKRKKKTTKKKSTKTRSENGLFGLSDFNPQKFKLF